MPLAVESRLGPYKVQSLIGAGAVGEVYRARDTRLNRDVAIKIIHAASADEVQRRRFELEARAASALNHPNILTVHDVGHEDGTSYIVTELIEGEPLRTILNNGRLSMRKALDIAIQIAGGLAAAHDAGIVHRDLKPENIMITPDGRAKILDFGLAKEAEEHGFGDADFMFGNNETLPGLLIGTTAYMSPEQAKGGRVNFYSDQFALGLILYEMLTGEQAFRRQTGLQTLSAILTEDPPELERGSVPLRWLVKRCLHKEPDHRYASTFDLLRELQNIRDHLTDPSGQFTTVEAPGGTSIATGKRRQLRSVLWPALALAAALICGAAGGYAIARLRLPVTISPGDARYLPFSAETGIEVMPAWSPNSRTVAYAAEINGVFQIVARSTGAAAPVQLTYGYEDCLFPFWSPDGVRVYYIAKSAGVPSLWSVGASGGSPELVVERVTQATIAPDGKTLALIRPDGDSYTLWTGSLTDSDFRRLDRGSFRQKIFLAPSYLQFAPDGTLGAWLALATGRSEFWLIPFPNGEPKAALDKLSVSPLAREFAWTPDSRRIVFSDRSGLSMHAHLYQAEVLRGRMEQITNGTGSELSPSIAAQGKTVAFASTTIDYDVIEIRLDGTILHTLKDPVSDVSPSASGDQLAYVTDRTGEPEIWLKTANQAWDRPIVTGNSFGEDKTLFLFDTTFAPDGRRIAYRRAGSHGEAIWISTIAGDPPIRLGKEPGHAFQRGPAWSPDGNEIAYSSMRNGRYALIRARVGGLEPPVVVAENTGAYPRWSPAGDWIATSGRPEGVTLFSADGKTRKKFGTGEWLLHGWTGDGKSVIGIRLSQNRKLDIVSIDISTGTEMAHGDLGTYPAGFAYANALGASPFRGFTLAADGRSFVTSMIRATGDIWLMERER